MFRTNPLLRTVGTLNEPCVNCISGQPLDESNICRREFLINLDEFTTNVPAVSTRKFAYAELEQTTFVIRLFFDFIIKRNAYW